MDAMATTILTLPSEILDLILQHLSSESQIFYQRAPSRRRLRCSRIDKNEVRGVLHTSSLLRSNAIPIFFRKHVHVFHSFFDLQDFINDKHLDPAIKSNLTRVAIDIGDMKDYDTMRLRHINTIASALDALPRLQSLECRVYARSDADMCMSELNKLWELWGKMQQAHLVATKGEAMSSAEYIKFVRLGRSLAKSLYTMKQQNIKMQLHSVTQKYCLDMKNMSTETIALKVCNMLVSKKASTTPLFGSAMEAVKDRMKMAGAIPLRDVDLMDRGVWRDELWEPCSFSRDVGDGYRW